MTDLKDIRDKIDEIDNELVRLFQERMDYVTQVSEYKKANGVDTDDFGREDAMIANMLPKVEDRWKDYYVDFQLELFRLSKLHQKRLNNETDQFIKEYLEYSEYTDAAFNASRRAKQDQDPDKINATVGCYWDDEGLKAFDTVYDTYNTIPNKTKAAYAGGIQGNANFNEAIWSWINRLDNITLYHRGVASPGGTGAIALPISNCLEKNNTLLVPDISWGTYKVMAKQNGLKLASYPVFVDGKLSVEGIKEKASEMMELQHKVAIVINDPCQNPLGTSLGTELWKDLIAHLNELSKQGPVMIINDIAYIDYAYDWQNATDYMSAFNDISENVVVFVAMSCSKTLSAYGMRMGEVIILSKEAETADHLYNTFVRYARANWSSINNSMQETFVKVVDEKKDEFLAEKQIAIDNLRERTELFVKQANECGLPMYPYQEGFFITLNISNDILDQYWEALSEQHIYGVPFNNGLRLAVCSLRMDQIDGLAYKLKEVLDRL